MLLRVAHDDAAPRRRGRPPTTGRRPAGGSGRATPARRSRGARGTRARPTTSPVIATERGRQLGAHVADAAEVLSGLGPSPSSRGARTAASRARDPLDPRAEARSSPRPSPYSGAALRRCTAASIFSTSGQGTRTVGALRERREQPPEPPAPAPDRRPDEDRLDPRLARPDSSSRSSTLPQRRPLQSTSWWSSSPTARSTVGHPVPPFVRIISGIAVSETTMMITR